jgi:hypothetical protein
MTRNSSSGERGSSRGWIFGLDVLPGQHSKQVDIHKLQLQHHAGCVCQPAHTPGDLRLLLLLLLW